MFPAPLDVKGLICVTPPYFALTDLCQHGPGEASATVPVETDPGRQATVIGIGEAGRHLAILGLSAASTVNAAPGRHYYLARSGTCQFLAGAVDVAASVPKVLRGHASATFTDPRHATAHTRLTEPDGTPVAIATVNYDVLTERLFHHFFGPPAVTEPVPVNPYTAAPPLSGLAVDGTTAHATLTVTPDLCPGHFDGHPALPVAISATSMTALVDELLAQAGPTTRWRPKSLTLEATALPWAGQTMELTASATAVQAGSQTLHCTAQIDGKTITTAGLTVDVLSTPSDRGGNIRNQV